MAAYDMVERDRLGSWRRVEDADLRQVAARLGTDGRAAAQRERYRLERLRYLGGRVPGHPNLFICQDAG
jgi:hypothetical protein